MRGWRGGDDARADHNELVSLEKIPDDDGPVGLGTAATDTFEAFGSSKVTSLCFPLSRRVLLEEMAEELTLKLWLSLEEARDEWLMLRVVFVWLPLIDC